MLSENDELLEKFKALVGGGHLPLTKIHEIQATLRKAENNAARKTKEHKAPLTPAIRPRESGGGVLTDEEMDSLDKKRSLLDPLTNSRGMVVEENEEAPGPSERKKSKRSSSEESLINIPMDVEERVRGDLAIKKKEFSDGEGGSYSTDEVNITGVSAPTTIEAAISNIILFAWNIYDDAEEGGKRISIIINKQRPGTSLGETIQENHIIAYATLLEMMRNLIDGENKEKAPMILADAAKCFMDEENIKTFNTWIDKEKEKIEKEIIDINEKLKAERVPKELKAFKRSNRELYASFLAETADFILHGINTSDLAVLPKIAGSPKDPKEGVRVNHATRDLKILDKLILLQENFKTVGSKDPIELINSFRENCLEIVDFAHPGTGITKAISNLNEILNQLLETPKHEKLRGNVHLDINGKDALSIILNSKINLNTIAKLSNDILDFKKEHVEDADKYKEKLKNGTEKNGKIVFNDLEKVLYMVTARYVNFIFTAFKNLQLLPDEQKQEVIDNFLKYVTESPKDENDNHQGWKAFKMVDETTGKRTLSLTIETFRLGIQEYLQEYLRNTPSEKKHATHRVGH